MKPSLVQRYLPRSPEVKLQRALLYAKKPNKKVPERVGAMEAADKSLESNVFAKILAARSKTDAHTRSTLPKALLYKLSVTDSNVFSAVSHYTVVKGQRGYLSTVAPLETRHKKQILKKPRYQGIPISKTYGEDLNQLAASDLQMLMQDYTPEGPKVLATKGQTDTNFPTINTNLDIPDIITVGKNQSGLRLAAFVYCQTYLQENRIR